MDSTYTANDIQVLTDQEHVRKRPAVYLGSVNKCTNNILLLSENNITIKEISFIPAVYKAIGEIIDNSIDEFSQITSRNKTLRIQAIPETGTYTIGDTGRGVPLDRHPTGKYTPEVVFGSLRSGRNFDDGKKQVGVQGTYGIGSSCTNYVSSDFEVTIHRDDKKYFQKFIDGASRVCKPKITKLSTNKQTGTEIKFQLDPTVFDDISLPDELIRNRAIELAVTNPDITVDYNGEKIKYKKGLIDVVNKIAPDKDWYRFEFSSETSTGEIIVILDATSFADEHMFTWVNSSLLFEGGKVNTQFCNAFVDKVLDHLFKDAKKLKIEVSKQDVKCGLLILANLKIKNPEFDSPAKLRLTGPDFKKDLSLSIDENWKSFVRKTNDTWLTNILERAKTRFHITENKKAIDNLEKKKKQKVNGLLDATSKNRFDCQLLITEGLSAKAGICEARNPITTAAYALTGKINNTYGCTPAQVLKMNKITELSSVIGLIPGKTAQRNNLNYGKIIIACDGDEDGNDIFSLLINFFYQFWPELFDPNHEPIVFRLLSPNVIASKAKKRVHFVHRNDYECQKHKYKGWEITYAKGLGSMIQDDWQEILSSDSYLQPIQSDSNFENVLRLLFSDNSNDRKLWLTTTE